MRLDDEAFKSYVIYLEAQRDAAEVSHKEKWDELLKTELQNREEESHGQPCN